MKNTLDTCYVFTLDSPAWFDGRNGQWPVPRQGGTIGRSPDCSWVIDDPNRIVSRQHARVDLDNAFCYWTDLGTNSTLLNGKPLMPGQRVQLNVGDRLAIGDCHIAFTRVEDNWTATPEMMAPVIEDPLASIQPAAEPVLNIDDLLAGLNGQGEQDQLADESAHALMAQRMYVGLQQGPALQVDTAPATIPVSVSGSVGPEFEQLSALFRASVQGYMQLLQARRVFREEMGGQLTSISARGNNPLKFSATADEAVQRLLAAESPAYLSGIQALEQACQDILAHMQFGIEQAQGVISQVRSGLDPACIEQELLQSSRVGLPLATSRKARLWDLYCERYARLGDLWN